MYVEVCAVCGKHPSRSETYSQYYSCKSMCDDVQLHRIRDRDHRRRIIPTDASCRSRGIFNLSSPYLQLRPAENMFRNGFCKFMTSFFGAISFSNRFAQRKTQSRIYLRFWIILNISASEVRIYLHTFELLHRSLIHRFGKQMTELNRKFFAHS